MSESYKGMTIPEYSDAADGPGGFVALVDSGPIPRFANDGDRDIALTSPVAGMLCYSGGEVQWYTGSIWTSLSDGGTPGAHTHAGTDIQALVPASSLPDASTSAQGVVQLSASTTSTSQSLAATPSAVKAAADAANHAHPYLPLSGGTVTGVTQFTAEVTFGQRILSNLGMLVNGYKSDAGQMQVRNSMVTDTLANVTDAVGKTGDTMFVYNAGSGSGMYARAAYAGGYNGTYWHKVAAL